MSLGIARYLGVKDIAQRYGLTEAAVSKWLERYPQDIPEPDVEVTGTFGWAPGRLAEWDAWRAARPKMKDRLTRLAHDR